MNIGIDVRKLRDYGIGTHIKNVIFPAMELDQENAYFLYCDPLDAKESAGRITWIPEESGKYSIREHLNLAQQASRSKLSIFHSPHYTLPLLLDCKSIVTVHDLIHLKFSEFFPAWKVAAAKLLLKRVLQKATVIVTVSKTSLNDILEFYPPAAEKTEVIYNRLSPEWLMSAPVKDLASLGIESNYILYAGNFKKHKGIESLVHAYSLLKDPPQLVLVGNPREATPDLMEQIFAVPRIRVLGFAEGELLHSLFASAMLFVFPSLYEGFGYPPLEAMSCGTPVLSSDAPALREILADSVEFFERGNAESLREKLEMLIRQSDRRTHLSELGLKRAKEYTTDDSPQKLLHLYRRLSK